MSEICSTYVALDEVLLDYLSLKDVATGKILRMMGGVVDHWLDRKQQLDLANTWTGEAFNPLGLIPLKETTHSRILGEFLNPRGSHGQNGLFLECLLLHLRIPVKERETWRIMVEEGRVDVMLIREEPRSVIIIENKSNDAGDQPNQLYRYWHQQVYLWDRDLNYQDSDVRQRFRVIYLPIDESKRPAPHSLQRPAGWELINPEPVIPLPCETIAFSELVTLFHQMARPLIPATNTRLLAFLDFYYDFWRSR
jgi:hypothetical protein